MILEEMDNRFEMVDSLGELQNKDSEIALIEKYRELILKKMNRGIPIYSDIYHLAQLLGDEERIYFDKLLQEEKFNYSTSIWVGIRALLHPTQDERYYSPFKINGFPGIYHVFDDGIHYHVDTIYGNIDVKKASEYFKNTKVEDIFQKTLFCKCFDRTLEFIKKMHDYQAVLCRISNEFQGEFYHVYAESDEHIVDLACNAFFENKEDAYKVLRGTTIKKANLFEVNLLYLKLLLMERQIRNKYNILDSAIVYYDVLEKKLEL